jgi:predicted HNH restriction endonuclease
VSNHKDRTTKLQYGRLFTQKLTQQRRRDGLCLNCGKPARAGKTQCQECADYHTRRRIKIRKVLKRKAVEYLGGRCVDCGIQSDYPDIYDFHHLLPVEKAAKIARLLDTTKSWEKVRIELDKCVLLCANCHRIRHAKEDEGRSPNSDLF